jgi:hypothetical protein
VFEPSRSDITTYHFSSLSLCINDFATLVDRVWSAITVSLLRCISHIARRSFGPPRVLDIAHQAV